MQTLIYSLLRISFLCLLEDSHVFVPDLNWNRCLIRSFRL